MNLITAVMICSMFPVNSIVNAMIQQGSQDHPLAITTVEQVGQPGETKTNFKTLDEALAYAQAQLQAGKKIEIGEMQIPSGWLEKLDQQGVTLSSLFRPCKNIAVATDLLNQAGAYCATSTNNKLELQLCTLSFYKTGDKKLGVAYAQEVLDYARVHPLQVNPQNSDVDYKTYLMQSDFALPSPQFSDDSEVNNDSAIEK